MSRTVRVPSSLRHSLPGFTRDVVLAVLVALTLTVAPSAARAAGPPTPAATGLSSSDTSSNDTPAANTPATDHAATPPRANATAANTATSAPRPLDLTAPDVRGLFSEEELKEPLPSIEQEEQAVDNSTVRVKSEAPTPDVPLGIPALWWALWHPTQAWRIFTPVQ